MRPRLQLKLFGRRAKAPAYPSEPVLRGNMRRVLVLRPPGDIFQEAVFVLRDDYFKAAGVGTHELMVQAQHAAEGFVAVNCPKSPRSFPSSFAAFALGAASSILALWLAGII